MTLHITNHAILRYQERVAPVSMEQARAILGSAMIQAAAAFGARFVRLAGNQRVVIKDGSVVTVLPAGSYQRQVMRRGLGRYGVGNIPEGADR